VWQSPDDARVFRSPISRAEKKGRLRGDCTSLKKYLVFAFLLLLAVFLWLFPEWRILGIVIGIAVGLSLPLVFYLAAAVSLFRLLLRPYNTR
jgi:hypothetical protein